MRSVPDRRAATTRWTDIDWMRGLAVLIMIQAHVLDAWTGTGVRGTHAFRYLEVVNGFAAPMFLWLAGLSLVLAGERTLRHTGSRREACHGLIGRGLEVFVLAFLFRLQSFVFNPGGEAIAIFRVDILNVMGLALAATGLVWGLAASRASQMACFAAAAAAVAMLTPVITAADWIDSLPVWCQWYVRPAGSHTVFTLFPWAGFVFGGAAAGSILTVGRLGFSRHRAQGVLASIGSCVLVLGLWTAAMPTIYRQSSFWTTSPAFFAIRAGILLLTAAAFHWLARAADIGSVELRPLGRLGRSSLFVYWIHVQVVYGWITWPLHRALGLGPAMGAVVLVSAVMYALVLAWDQVPGFVRRGASGGLRGKVEADVPGKVSGKVAASV